MFQEALDILTAGLSNREVSYEGKYFAFRPVRLHIEPF
jgi:alkanesulfonate monooxygenase SsuD/methylene tetrahydromethanopterin reductase-like flavin-dependent oxidoreductase (luciferase family)